MTATTTHTAPAAQSAADAEKLLRDVAYVLKLTRRVKDEMAADRAQTQAPAANPDRALVA
ncbi:MAG: hypothetical protein K2V38_25525 [Gemmataceae bacterium]|nr:hypothetical protein [Gemmataceae bacterium]